METVVSSNGISKTVETEKEAFLCSFRWNTSGTVIKKNVESISCLKDIDTAMVLKCATKKHM